MARDKFKAVWVSHSSISDFLQCPRAYFLKNVYKDRLTGHKITLMNPHLALGQAVHEVIESISTLPVRKRFAQPLLGRFEDAWEKVRGSKGGFENSEQEEKFKERGRKMIERMEGNLKPLANLAIKLKEKEPVPHFWLSEEENIILCGKIDWLEYLSETDSVHIVDFKSGQHEEDDGSLQLPIYYLLASNCQPRKVTKVSYWYLARDNHPVEQRLPDIDTAYQEILQIAREIKQARKEKNYKCKRKGCCYACCPLEEIIKGKGRLVGIDEMKRDVYVLPVIKASLQREIDRSKNSG